MGISRNGDAVRFDTGYLDTAWENPTRIIEGMRAAMKGIKYDTIVVSGHSGVLIGPILARALRKKLFVVRKHEDCQSSHSNRPWIGQLGARWVMVDDFISSGATVTRVVKSVLQSVEAINGRYRYPTWDQNLGVYVDPESEDPFATTFVGFYGYERAMFLSKSGLAERMYPRYFQEVEDTLNPPPPVAEPEPIAELKAEDIVTNCNAPSITIKAEELGIGMDSVFSASFPNWTEVGYVTDSPVAFTPNATPRGPSFDQLLSEMKVYSRSPITLPTTAFKLTEVNV